MMQVTRRALRSQNKQEIQECFDYLRNYLDGKQQPLVRSVIEQEIDKVVQHAKSLGIVLEPQSPITIWVHHRRFHSAIRGKTEVQVLTTGTEAISRFSVLNPDLHAEYYTIGSSPKVYELFEASEVRAK